MPQFADQERAQGILTGPNKFECEVTPRSSRRVEIIKREFLGAVQDFEPFEKQLDLADREFVDNLRRELADELHPL